MVWMTLLLLLLLLLWPVAAQDDEVLEELQTFLRTKVEPNAERYIEWLREESKTKGYAALVIGPECLEKAAGRLLRHRCCVVYSNLAAAMLYGEYGTLPKREGSFHDDLKNLQDYHSTQRESYHPQELDILLRMWAINNEQRQGIYRAPLNIKGVDVVLSKCEFLETHTFLRLQLLQGGSSTGGAVLVDMSWKQIVLMSIMPEEMEDAAKERASEDLADAMTHLPDSVAFFEGDAHREFHAPKFRILLQDAGIWQDPSHASVFPDLHGMILGMYSSQFLNNVCGKTSAQIMAGQQQQQQQDPQRVAQEQQQRAAKEREQQERAAKAREMQERMKLLKNLELPQHQRRHHEF